LLPYCRSDLFVSFRRRATPSSSTVTSIGARMNSSSRYGRKVCTSPQPPTSVGSLTAKGRADGSGTRNSSLLLVAYLLIDTLYEELTKLLQDFENGLTDTAKKVARLRRKKNA
ncbi:hypothetical protein TGPRC2_359310, partial [Toxoplasma gondii TgCatPRC2]